jgi:lysyl-tRNA synthetase class 2
MVEWYEAYADYEDVATELEGLVSSVAQDVLGTTKIERDGETIELAPPWRRVTLRDAIRERTGIDVIEHPSREELAKAMDSEPDPEEGWGKLVDGLLSKEVEPTLIQPTFVMDYPVELSPFAKLHRSARRRPAATKRPSPTTRPSSRPSSRECHRPAGRASGSIAW